MSKLNINNLKKVHCVGIGGIGVSAIAKFFNSREIEVSGSDAKDFNDKKNLEDRGIKIFIGHKKENVVDNTNLIIYSSAIPENNPELVNDTPKLKYTEVLGLLMSHYFSIAVSGTNGKTTTTTILGKILEYNRLDPTVVVGGKVSGWDGNLLLGKGDDKDDIFLAEVCEYKRGMMNVDPNTIILTNLEEDHLDYYKDIEDIKSAFTDYILKLKEDDLLIYNKDDINLRSIVGKSKSKKISYAIENPADLEARNIEQGEGYQKFEVYWRSVSVGPFKIHIPGIFNIYNTLAAIAGAMSLGISDDLLLGPIEDFRGTWRRFEKVGEVDGKIIISDYAHHPRAVSETIKGAKKFYPSKKVLVIFQPHQKDRTIKLFDDFIESFNDADEVIISEIYEVESRNESLKEISSKDLVDEIKKRNPNFLISYAKNLEETEKMVKEKMVKYDIILIMGAGDIYKIANNLVKK